MRKNCWVCREVSNDLYTRLMFIVYRSDGFMMAGVKIGLHKACLTGAQRLA